MYYVRLKDDKHNRRWKVRQAVSLQAAISCINWVMASGCIGGKDCATTYNNGYSGPVMHKVIADVVRVNSDNTEAQPYQTAY